MPEEKDTLEISPSAIIIVVLLIVISILVGLNISSDKDKAEEDVTSEVAGEEIVVEEDSKFGDPSIKSASVKVDLDDLVKIGEASDLIILEFSDYLCPFCERHAKEVFPLILEKYINTGEVAYAFNDTPSEVSLAGLCIYEDFGSDAFLEYRKKTYDINYQSDEDIFEVFDDLGFDSKSCYEAGTYSDRLNSNSAKGDLIGLTGVPGFLVGKVSEDGTVSGYVIPGAYPISQFDEIIEYLKTAE